MISFHWKKNARLIITDSGGLQKEAYFFKKPCVILREQTEWVEIVKNGNAILTGSNYDKIKSAIINLLEKMIIPTHQFLAMEMQVNLFALKF